MTGREAIGDGWKYISILNYMDGMDFDENENDEKKLVSMILHYNDSYEDSNLKMFVNISRRSLKDKFDNHYTETIKSLLDKGYIEVNKNYSEGSFTKSYRIAEPYWNNERIFLESRKRQISPYKDRSITTNENERYVHQCLKQLEVTTDPETINVVTPIRRKLGIDSLQHITVGDVNFKKGKNSDRFFHNFLSMPKEYRECCTLDGSQLVTVDIKSAHPTFCYSFYKNIPNSAYEADKYKDILNNHDIYEFLTKDISRDDAKIEMVKFLSSEKTYTSTVSKSFQNEFPLLYGYIDNQEKLCLYLQNLEAKIVCSHLVTKCRDLNFPIITEHDGFRALPSQVDQMNGWLSDIIEYECGIIPVIKMS